MKTTIRIFLAGAVVLILAFGAWSGVFAEKSSSSAGRTASLSKLFAPLFQASTETSEVEKQMPEASETPQAMEDNPGREQDDTTPEATEASEAGDDNQVQHEAAATPEAHEGELSGTVTAITGNSVTIDGKVFQLSGNLEDAGNLQVGEMVKVEFVTNADGTVTVREIKVRDQLVNSEDSNQSGHDSSGDHQGGGSDSGSGGHDGSGSGDGGGGGGDGGGSDG